MGRDGFIWFHGVVEDRQDPDMLGKVKVRILGYHTQDKSYIKTEDLQWAYVAQGITSAAMNGLGETPLGVVPGTWVFGFFRDGTNCQDPCIIGTFGGIPQIAPDPTKGFNDPRDSSGTTELLGTAPRKIAFRSYPFDGTGAAFINGVQGPQYPQTDYLKEPDTNRIARNQKIENTLLQVVKGTQDIGVQIAFNGTWDEPALWYNGTYPYVHVFESESGHVKVIDDTPNHEGQLDIDRTGTFRQIQTDGSEIHKIVKNGYTIVLQDNHIHIMNDQHTCIGNNYTLSIGGTWNVEVVGNINIKSDYGGAFITVEGDANIKARGDVNVESCTDVNVIASRDASVNCAGNLTLTAMDNINLVAGNAINMDAGQVWINSQMSMPAEPVHATEPPQ
jgi:hypothetical protein